MKIKSMIGYMCVACIATSAVFVVPAVAHHSFAAYNMQEIVEKTGTIKEFRWGAPHSSVIVTYEEDSGEKLNVSLVSGSPLMFSRQGFKPRDFHRGDAVVVTYHPNVNGAPGGALSTLTLPDGKTFKDTEAAGSQ